MALDISELFDLFILELGQGDVSGFSTFELDLAKCLKLVNPVLGLYNRYRPAEEMLRLRMNGNWYDFTHDPHGIPKWVSRVTPVGNNILSDRQYLLGAMGVSKLKSKIFIWQYRKPELYTQYAGDFEVRAVYNHVVKSTTTGAAPNEVTTYTIETMDYDEYMFLDLLRAKVALAIARNRNAFTISERQMSTDSASMISDATAREREAMSQLITNSKSYLTMG